MTSKAMDVIESAASQLAAWGTVGHFFSTCTPGGFVNAREVNGVACTACQINAIADAHLLAETDNGATTREGG